MSSDLPLILASSSPRRKQLLEEAGYRPRVERPDVDDGPLQPGPVTPERWVMSLAYLKARQVTERLRSAGDLRPGAVVIGADTICAHGEKLYGQPAGAAEARHMIFALRDAAHRTITGVALIDGDTDLRRLHSDEAIVQIGALRDDEVDHYLASETWRGKAGGYNLIERQAAGWPIKVQGDPTTVMGLPMRKLPSWLQGLRAAAAHGSRHPLLNPGEAT